MTDIHDLISARTAHIGGGIPVARLLPNKSRRTIGAWCFLDHAGPAEFAPGTGMRVGPHPHIALQTFTWMIAGEVLHRDSLGSVQVVRPGQVNLMTAGAGISHTEECLAEETELHAAQLWIALPPHKINIAPAFDHYDQVPRWTTGLSQCTLLAGSYGEHTAPTRVYSPLIGMELLSTAPDAQTLTLNPDFEYGILVLEGSASALGIEVAQDQLLYLAPGAAALDIHLSLNTRVLLVGGEPLPEDLLIWWNFVGYDRDSIIQAAADWAAADPRFGEVKGFDGPRLVAPELPWPAQ